jgi:GNAT superfamily N-acetyltransferase
VTVREARQEDADAIAELLGELGYPADAATVRDRLARMGSADAVLLADGGLVALHRIPLLAEGGGLARITALVVAERQRRTGLGEALLAAAEDLATAVRLRPARGLVRPAIRARRRARLLPVGRLHGHRRAFCPILEGPHSATIGSGLIAATAR